MSPKTHKTRYSILPSEKNMHNSDSPNLKGRAITRIRELSHSSQISKEINNVKNKKPTEIPIEKLNSVKEKIKNKTLPFVVMHNPQIIKFITGLNKTYKS